MRSFFFKILLASSKFSFFSLSYPSFKKHIPGQKVEQSGQSQEIEPFSSTCLGLAPGIAAHNRVVPQIIVG